MNIVLRLNLAPECYVLLTEAYNRLQAAGIDEDTISIALDEIGRAFDAGAQLALGETSAQLIEHGFNARTVVEGPSA